LGLQNGSDGFDGVAIVELHGEWVLGQCDTDLLVVSLQGRLEKGAKTSRF